MADKGAAVNGGAGGIGRAIGERLGAGAVGRTPYAASKAATVAFSKSLALELAPYGVRVNTIAPGVTETARIQREYSEADWRKIGEALPMGRTALPTDIAEGVAFLA